MKLQRVILVLLGMMLFFAGKLSAQDVETDKHKGTEDSSFRQWRIAGQNLNNTWNQAAEHLINPDNVKGLSPKWVFTAGGDVSATPVVAADTALIEAHIPIVDRSVQDSTGRCSNHRRAPLRYLLEYRRRSTRAPC